MCTLIYNIVRLEDKTVDKKRTKKVSTSTCSKG